MVELVDRLRDLNFLENNLLHTINGKEYLIHAQLRKEIKETLDSAGGRVSLVQLIHSSLS